MTKYPWSFRIFANDPFPQPSSNTRRTNGPGQLSKNLQDQAIKVFMMRMAKNIIITIARKIVHLSVICVNIISCVPVHLRCSNLLPF